jgi:hypothetical protein
MLLSPLFEALLVERPVELEQGVFVPTLELLVTLVVSLLGLVD